MNCEGRGTFAFGSMWCFYDGCQGSRGWNTLSTRDATLTRQPWVLRFCGRNYFCRSLSFGTTTVLPSLPKHPLEKGVLGIVPRGSEVLDVIEDKLKTRDGGWERWVTGTTEREFDICFRVTIDNIVELFGTRPAPRVSETARRSGGADVVHL